MAGALREATLSSGLSLGDRACLALASRKAFPSSPWTGSGQMSRKRWVSRSSLRDEHRRRGEQSVAGT